MAAGVVQTDVNRVGTSRLYLGMKRIAFVAITLFALAGCASGEAAESAKGDNSASESTSPSPSSESADAPSDAWAGEVLPDSTWTKTVTLKQAKKAGVPQAEVPPNFGEDGLMPLTFVFESDSWAIMVVNDDGAAEPGDLGTLTYDDQGRLVTTSNSEGCPGCVITLRWEVVRDTLTIATVEKSGDPLEKLILSGQWERSS